MLALAPTAAHAQGAEVFPGSGSPGTKVTVNDGNLCAGTSASATSAAFGTIQLSKGTQTMVGSGTVKNVPNGSYGIKLTCGNGKSASGTFTVTGSSSTKPATKPTTKPGTKPKGGVKAGAGGTVAETNTAGLAAGGGLLLGGAALGVYALRRRTASHPTA